MDKEPENSASGETAAASGMADGMAEGYSMAGNGMAGRDSTAGKESAAGKLSGLELAKMAAFAASSLPAALTAPVAPVAPALAATTSTERICELYIKHGKAMKFKDIAEAVGVTPGFVSQVIADNLEIITEARAELLASQQDKSRDRADKLDRMESRLLERLENEVIPFVGAKSILPVLAALNKIPRYHQQPAIEAAKSREQTEFVDLVLPQIAVTQFNLHVDQHNRVVAIGDQTLRAASAEDVKRMLPELAENVENTNFERLRTGAQAASQRLSDLAVGRRTAGANSSDLSFD